MSIQQAVKDIHKTVADMRDSGPLDHRVIDIAVEATTQWLEYLDELELYIKPAPFDGVTVKVDGQAVKFKSIEDVATWITSL